MRYRPKYKVLLKLRENIWKTTKPLKFKKLKWQKMHRFFFSSLLFKRRELNKKSFFNKDFRMRYFFKNMLKTKKIFLNTFGFFKPKQIKKIINNSKRISINYKASTLMFNKISINSIKYNHTLYFMQSLEKRLITTFSRSRLFQNFFMYIHYIKKGYVFVNDKIIKNPFYTLSIGDVICFKPNDNKINLNKRFLRKNYGVRKKNLKSKHLLFSSKGFKILFIKLPTFSDLRYLNNLNWSFFFYLLKLKR